MGVVCFWYGFGMVLVRFGMIFVWFLYGVGMVWVWFWYCVDGFDMVLM